MRRPMTSALALAGLALLPLAGCVSLVPDEVMPMASLQPVDPALLAPAGPVTPETIRTAKSGDIVLSQPLQSAAVYTLENAPAPVGDVSLAVQAREVTFTAGQTFYPAINLGSQTKLVACSFDKPVVWTPRLNPDAKGSGKVCFELADLAVPVDPIVVSWGLKDASATQIFFVNEGAGLYPSASAFQTLMRWDPSFRYEVSPPARLKLSRGGAVADGGPRIGLRFLATGKGGTLEFVGLTGEVPGKLDREPVVIAADTVFPVTVDADGAQIELLALTDGVLAYRVKAGFPPDLGFVVNLPQ